MKMTKKLIKQQIKKVENGFDYEEMKYLIGFTKQWVSENKRRNKGILRQLTKVEDELFETEFIETDRVIKLVEYILN